LVRSSQDPLFELILVSSFVDFWGSGEWDERQRGEGGVISQGMTGQY